MDRTNKRYMRPKLKPYREEKVLYRPRPGDPVGDTRLQREMVEERRTEMVYETAGLDRDHRTWGDALTMLNPFSRFSSRAYDLKEGPKLPLVNLKEMPKSWDPRAEAAERDDDGMKFNSPSQEEEGVEDDAPIGSVDVAMTRMGEPWMTV
ncbi:hypothetical protein VTI74DRAFT_2640 [Chaetomium olivicolor]